MLKRAGIFSVLFAAAALLAAKAIAAPVDVSISVFHDQLAPHGRWVTARSYGSVWVPSGVARGWEPYVDGQWVYSDYGWTWDSDDPWGDVPYHYGTWAWVDGYGWAWVPGTVWAPAWVTWAYTDEYVGWAPVPPTFALTATGYFGPPIVVPAARYIFVPAPKFIGVRVASVRVPAAQSAVFFPRAVKTTRFEVGNGFVRVAGPPAKTIERAVGRPLERVPVERLRAQPTTMSAGGVAHGHGVRVVATEKERAHLTTERAEAKPAHAAAPAHSQAAHSSSTRTANEPRATKETKETKEQHTAQTHRAPAEHAQSKPAPQAVAPQKAHAAPPEKAHVTQEKAKASPHSSSTDRPQGEKERAAQPQPARAEPPMRQNPEASAARPHSQPPAESKPREKQAPPKENKEKEHPPKDSGANPGRD